MKKSEKLALIKEINDTLKTYEYLCKKFEKIDWKIFNTFLFKGKLKQERLAVFQKLVTARDKIVEYEKKYNLELGESPHCSFITVVNGGYGWKLSRAKGDLGFVKKDGYFPRIVHELPEDAVFNSKKKRKLLPFEKEIMRQSDITSKQYGLEGFDVNIENIDKGTIWRN